MQEDNLEKKSAKDIADLKRIVKYLRKDFELTKSEVFNLERVLRNKSMHYKANYVWGLEIPERAFTDTEYVPLKDGLYLSKFSKDSGKTISIPDCGKQPESDEMLLVISFPSGPYVFGQHYPVELFYKFFAELKTYKPKFVDSANKSLYFSVDPYNSETVALFKGYHDIFTKYEKKTLESIRQERIKAAKALLEELESPCIHE